MPPSLLLHRLQCYFDTRIRTSVLQSSFVSFARRVQPQLARGHTRQIPHPSSLSPHAHCGQQLCQCDIDFANCVSRYPCPRRRASCQHSKFAAFHGFLHGKKR
ncbi:hypothetical protein MTO96_012687 [Rhipicephalus appendiculatus]